jgi:thymidylate synthase (FAD)
MARMNVPQADELIDRELPVLDKGFVRLVDYLGGDERVVQAARVSYGQGTKGFRQDRQLIRYLLRNEHTSPFEQVVLTFHVKLPIFVARQWIRHRTARVNEISGRYSVLDDDFYLPPPEQLRYQSSESKQGRAEECLPPDVSEQVRTKMAQGQQRAYAEYRELLELGLSREVARINLPLSIYTQWYWQIDLHNLMHFLKLRLDAHAQWEIREYAQRLATCAAAVAPLSYEAFDEFVLRAGK